MEHKLLLTFSSTARVSQTMKLEESKKHVGNARLMFLIKENRFNPHGYGANVTNSAIHVKQ